MTYVLKRLTPKRAVSGKRPKRGPPPARAHSARIPEWHEIDSRAKFAPPRGYPLPIPYVRYLQTQNIHFGSKLGSGGYATVWRATITKVNELNIAVTMDVACKVMSLHRYRQKYLIQAVIYMMDEAKLVQQLDHQHLVRTELMMHLEDLHPRFKPISFPYMHVLIFMELCDEDLRHYLKRTKRRMSETTAYKWFVQIADALRYLHYDRRIAHLDIKPRNILIKRHAIRANEAIVKLTDFGLALQFEEGEMTAFGEETVGTDEYMAPEVWSGTRYDACIADIFSLGVTLVESLTDDEYARDDMVFEINYCLPNAGQFPSVDRDYIESTWNISPDLIDLLVGMLEEVPDLRFDVNKVWFHQWVCQKPYASGTYFYLPPN